MGHRRNPSSWHDGRPLSAAAPYRRVYHAVPLPRQPDEDAARDADPTPTVTRTSSSHPDATAAAAAGVHHRAPARPGRAAFVAPSDKVNVAIIGAGGQGRTNTRALFQEDDCQVIALADPAEEWDLSSWYYGGKAGRGPVKRGDREALRARRRRTHTCAVYEDFRVMLEKEKAIDAVLIATPDHLHAYVSILAMKAGKHVYCEKPLTHNIHEARLVARVAKETGVATQMGNHGRSSEGHRADRRVDQGRRDRRRARGARLERRPRTGASAGLARRGTGGQAGRAQLGPVARPARRAALQREVRALRLALGVGLRQRHDARHGAAPLRSRVQRARPRRARSPIEAATSVRRSGGDAWAATGDLPVRARRATAARSRCSGTTAVSGRRRRSVSIPTIRGSGSATATTGCWSSARKASLTCPGWSGMPRLLPMELHRVVQAAAEDACRASPGTTPTGCRPARAARRRAATSSTARGSPSSSCSARWRSGPARSSSGTRTP